MKALVSQETRVACASDVEQYFIQLHSQSHLMNRQGAEYMEAGSWIHGGRRLACTVPFREQLWREESLQQLFKKQQQQIQWRGRVLMKAIFEVGRGSKVAKWNDFTHINNLDCTASLSYSQCSEWQEKKKNIFDPRENPSIFLRNC